MPFFPQQAQDGRLGPIFFVHNVRTPFVSEAELRAVDPEGLILATLTRRKETKPAGIVGTAKRRSSR